MKSYITSAVFALICFWAVLFNILANADNFAEDFLYHRPDGTAENIKIIKIDEKTMSDLGDFSEWDRGIYAKLIDTLCVSEEIRPVVIGFDMLFSGSDSSDADAEFAAACERHGNVVCAFSYVFERELEYDENGKLTVNNLSAAQKVMPYSELLNTADTGFANALTDNHDGVIRKAFLYIDKSI